MNLSRSHYATALMSVRHGIHGKAGAIIGAEPDYTMTTLSLSPTWIGMAAALLTTAAYAPQAIQAWRSRSTKDVSLAMFAMMVTGITLWLIYGILINDIPLILANAVTLIFASAILVAKIRFS